MSLNYLLNVSNGNNLIYLSSIVCLILFLFLASLIALAVWDVRNFFSAPVRSEVGFRNIWVNFLTDSLWRLAASIFFGSLPRWARFLFLSRGASILSSGSSATSMSLSSSSSLAHGLHYFAMGCNLNAARVPFRCKWDAIRRQWGGKIWGTVRCKFWCK